MLFRSTAMEGRLSLSISTTEFEEDFDLMDEDPDTDEEAIDFLDCE